MLNLDSLTLTFKSSHFAPGAPPTNEVADTAIKCVLAYARVLVTCITTHAHTVPPSRVCHLARKSKRDILAVSKWSGDLQIAVPLHP